MNCYNTNATLLLLGGSWGFLCHLSLDFTLSLVQCLSHATRRDTLFSSVISPKNYRVPLFAFLLNWVSEKFMSKL